MEQFLLKLSILAIRRLESMPLLRRFIASIAFYTCIPIPSFWAIEFGTVARFAPIVGLGIGGGLALLDWGFGTIGMPNLTRSALLVALWIAVTGGLHLDGVMDTADGLAVTDPKRRLEVMADSHTGAFGAIAAVVLILLKTVALAEILKCRWLILLLVPGWGRWAQQIAIARYPYLKLTGKGAFHKQAIRSLFDTLPALFLLLGLSLASFILLPDTRPSMLLLSLGGASIALLIPAWFNRKVGGQTGDTYGAAVEWTEALLLVLLTLA